MDHQMPIMATRIEVSITDEKGFVTRWVSDDFDYVEVETMHTPGFYSDDFFAKPISPPRLSRLSFHVEHPKKYTIYDPRINQRAVDPGDIVEEAPPGPPNPPNPIWNRPFG